MYWFFLLVFDFSLCTVFLSFSLFELSQLNCKIKYRGKRWNIYHIEITNFTVLIFIFYSFSSRNYLNHLKFAHVVKMRAIKVWMLFDITFTIFKRNIVLWNFGVFFAVFVLLQLEFSNNTSMFNIGLNI